MEDAQTPSPRRQLRVIDATDDGHVLSVEVAPTADEQLHAASDRLAEFIAKQWVRGAMPESVPDEDPDGVPRSTESA